MEDRRIEALVDDLQPVRPSGAAPFLARVIVAFLCSAGFVLLAAQPRPDLAIAVASPSFWFKQFILALPLVIGAVMTWRLARPSEAPSISIKALLAVFAVAVVGALLLIEAFSRQPMAEVRSAGAGGLHCLFFAAAASTPMLLFGLQWLRTMAPTQIRAASLSLGLLAGGVGTSAYALHCPYESAGYIALWYGLSVVTAIVGAGVFLPRRLAW